MTRFVILAALGVTITTLSPASAQRSLNDILDVKTHPIASNPSAAGTPPSAQQWRDNILKPYDAKTHLVGPTPPSSEEPPVSSRQWLDDILKPYDAKTHAPTRPPATAAPAMPLPNSRGNSAS